MAELKFPTFEEFGRQAGEWALDEFEYKGRIWTYGSGDIPQRNIRTRR